MKVQGRSLGISNTVNVLNTFKKFHMKRFSLGKRQTVGLEKLAAFCRNTSLVETRQEELHKKCLEFWKIPNLCRIPHPQFTADELLNLSVDKPGRHVVSRALTSTVPLFFQRYCWLNQRRLMTSVISIRYSRTWGIGITAS